MWLVRLLYTDGNLRSLESGLYRNEAWTGFFGLIAALASFRGGWAATAQVAAPFQDDP